MALRWGRAKPGPAVLFWTTTTVGLAVLALLAAAVVVPVWD